MTGTNALSHKQSYYQKEFNTNLKHNDETYTHFIKYVHFRTDT